MSTESAQPRSALSAQHAALARWFALLGGHAGWTAQTLVGFALAAPACAPGAGPYAVLAVTVAAVAVAAAAGAAALGLARRSGPAPAARRDRFLGLVGLFLNGVFLYAIVLAGSGLVLVGACG